MNDVEEDKLCMCMLGYLSTYTFKERGRTRWWRVGRGLGGRREGGISGWAYVCRYKAACLEADSLILVKPQTRSWDYVSGMRI